MKDAGEPGRLAVLDAEGDDVLDLDVDGVTDPHGVSEAVLAKFDRRPLDTQRLADETGERSHRPAHRAREDAAELLRLLVGGGRVDEQAETPVSLAHHLWRVGHGGDGEPADADSVDLAVLYVEDEHDPAAIERRAQREGRCAGADDIARAALEIRAF